MGKLKYLLIIFLFQISCGKADIEKDLKKNAMDDFSNIFSISHDSENDRLTVTRCIAATSLAKDLVRGKLKDDYDPSQDPAAILNFNYSSIALKYFSGAIKKASQREKYLLNLGVDDGSSLVYSDVVFCSEQFDQARIKYPTTFLD